MTLESDLKRLKELAGVTNEKPNYIVLLPSETNIAEIKTLLAVLKKLDGGQSNWTEIEIDGVKYIATGVARDF